MSSTNSPYVLQVLHVPYRPVHTDEDIQQDLNPAIQLLFGANGLIAAWRGKRYEDRFTYIYLLLWKDLASSHAFFTSEAYREFNHVVQPALNGRKIFWQQHALVGQSELDDITHLKSIVDSPCIEVALTKVVEGGVSGYYRAFRSTISRILDDDPGCDGWWISPQVENPQHQILMINWKSVD
ncbi:hypothetical protein ACLOAV_002852 [Pseudogymnoascus australis]